jgi:hypothetical protein
MVNWLATLVKLPAEIGRLGWQLLVSRLAIRTEPISAFITYYFTYEPSAPLAELLERLVDVVYGEHDA